MFRPGREGASEMRLFMKPQLQLMLSVITIMALVATPSLAKRNPHLNHMSNPASTSSVIVRDGRIIGSDLDANIRLQIMRDYQRTSANGGSN